MANNIDIVIIQRIHLVIYKTIHNSTSSVYALPPSSSSSPSPATSSLFPLTISSFFVSSIDFHIQQHCCQIWPNASTQLASRFISTERERERKKMQFFSTCYLFQALAIHLIYSSKPKSLHLPCLIISLSAYVVNQFQNAQPHFVHAFTKCVQFQLSP